MVELLLRGVSWQWIPNLYSWNINALVFTTVGHFVRISSNFGICWSHSIHKGASLRTFFALLLCFESPTILLHGCFSVCLPCLCTRDADFPRFGPSNFKLSYRNIAHRYSRRLVFQPCYQQPGQKAGFFFLFLSFYVLLVFNVLQSKQIKDKSLLQKIIIILIHILRRF